MDRRWQLHGSIQRAVGARKQRLAIPQRVRGAVATCEYVQDFEWISHTHELRITRGLYSLGDHIHAAGSFHERTEQQRIAAIAPTEVVDDTQMIATVNLEQS